MGYYLPKTLREFAFTQDPGGEISFIRGKEYEVYGYNTNDLGRYYLVLPQWDQDSSELTPWWMPVNFFDPTSITLPKDWEQKVYRGSYGQTVFHAPAIYFGAEEDIEDGTERGIRIFEEMKKKVKDYK